MALLSKEAILGASDIKTEDIDVPEWGGSVRVAVMSGAARDRFMELNTGADVPASLFQARLLASTVIDEDGNLLFSIDDVEALRGRSRVALDMVSDAAMRLNGLKAEAVEDAAKNSAAAPSGDSGSSSPSTSESL